MDKSNGSVLNEAHYHVSNRGRGCIVIMSRQPSSTKASLMSRFREHTQKQHTRYESPGRVIGPTHRHLTTLNAHKRQTFMPPTGFEPTIPGNCRDLRLRPRGHRDQRQEGTARRILTLGTRWGQALSSTRQ
jgi:hypothetical protein